MRKIIEETDQKNATLELHLRAQSGYSADEKVKISPNQWGKIVRIITQEKMELPSIEIFINGLPNFLLLRKNSKMTLRFVEEKTGISNCYLSQLETGKIKKPSFNAVIKLVRLYYGF